MIKAHRHRQVYMRDVSILRQPFPPYEGKRVVALVDPECDTVVMTEDVAKMRGLRGLSPQSQAVYKGPLSTNGKQNEVPEGKSIYFKRRSKVKESHRRVAEINISHDGDYATAVCMALDSPQIHPELRRIVDYGDGPPMHEVEWGDDGWFDQEEFPENEEQRRDL